MASSGQPSEYGATSGVSSEIPPPTSKPSPTSEQQHNVLNVPTLSKKAHLIPETITKGRSLRVQKNTMPKRSARPPPTPAMPRGMVATDRDVKMSRRAMRRQARCLRKHNIVLSDRMDELSKPTRRQLINMWRTYADVLTPEQIVNLQNMLDASDPFKPDQAYEYFVNLRKQRKRTEEKDKAGKKDQKKDLSALCGDRRFAWARSATVAFARGIQQRLSRPGNFQLEDNMLRLSDIVLQEMCCYSKMRIPSRQSKNPKAKFMVEMADKIAVWIDEILGESDERMLMMDFDEDDEEVQHVEDTDENCEDKGDHAKEEREKHEREKLEKQTHGEQGKLAADGANPAAQPGAQPSHAQPAGTQPAGTATPAPSGAAAATPAQPPVKPS